MTKNTKILPVILISLLFIFTGLFLSIKISSDKTRLASHPKGVASIREKAKVSFVYDGDTIELTDKRRVRYIGINTPEMNWNKGRPQCFASESAKINKELVAGQEIEMEKDMSEKDKYGRLLRYVYIDGLFMNDFLLRQGYAKLDLVAPDTHFSIELKGAEREAREAKRGMWGKCQKS